jgi:hypothetical protein
MLSVLHQQSSRGGYGKERSRALSHEICEFGDGQVNSIVTIILIDCCYFVIFIILSCAASVIGLLAVDTAH